jgi:hypothetical protein
MLEDQNKQLKTDLVHCHQRVLQTIDHEIKHSTQTGHVKESEVDVGHRATISLLVFICFDIVIHVLVFCRISFDRLHVFNMKFRMFNIKSIKLNYD